MRTRKKMLSVIAVIFCTIFCIWMIIPFSWKLDIAEADTLHCLLRDRVEGEYTFIRLSGEMKDLVASGVERFRYGWPKRDDNEIRYDKTADEAEYYIHLVCVGKASLDIFVMKDGTLAAEINSWVNEYEYTVKNPEVLQPFVELLLLENAD